jgi:predicted transposase/invertase (TIGR01784 family)
MRYLDPKADLTFKKIFGEHKNLAISLLNSLLPLEIPIISIEYLSGEQVPVIDSLKNSIVDVRCTDKNNRTFIVEMQMYWTDSFKQRVLFNSSKSYVKQLDKGVIYKGLQSVYALSLVNEIFEPSMPEFYHHYQMTHAEDNSKKLEGIELVFVELPKFMPSTLGQKKMQILWLRFLTEIKDGTREIPIEFLENKEIKEALDVLEESSFTNEELEQYDKYWDWVQSERTLISEAEELGILKGKIEGEEIGFEKGIEKGIEKALFRNKLTIEEIAEDFEVSIEHILEIKRRYNL